jgi:hypothetical protein
MKSPFRAFFRPFFTGVSLLLILSTAHAQSTAPGAGSNDTASIKYLGTQDDMLVFDVWYSNPTGDKFLVSVKDQDGVQLYQHFFSEKSIYKQFRLPKSEKDRIVFVIRDFKDADIVKTFEVNVNSRLIREVAVKRIN